MMQVSRGTGKNMGFKLSLVLGILLFSSVFYIKNLQEQLAVSKGNQKILENKIDEQNASIDDYLENQEKIYSQIEVMEAEKNQAIKEVSNLRNKFARHDMNSLALAKPKLLEKRVNNGTKKIIDSIVTLTNPNQFKQVPVVTKQVLSPSKDDQKGREGDI